MQPLCSVAVVIPAYQPTEALPELVEALAATSLAAIVLVDDGSGPEYSGLFERASGHPKVTTVRHAVNLGKGAALKSGMNHVLLVLPGVTTIVTADADGQHHASDICRVAAAGRGDGGLVLGGRRLGRGVPWRSRVGNAVTRFLFRLLVGRRLHDTQTGLRSIPAALVPRLLRLPSNGYEFELDMLLLCRHLGLPISEVEIQTIYENGNASSHFNPLFDSMRIYFVLLRFSAVALTTALLDNAVFIIAFASGAGIATAQIVARGTALAFNYAGVRRAVFLSRGRHHVVFPRYVLLVLTSGMVSYGLIRVLTEGGSLAVVHAKLLAESVLFIANFAVQRDFVFTTRDVPGRGARTDWDRYYDAVPPTARLTRRYTGRILLRAMRLAGLSKDGPPGTLVEIGGANSCFLDRIAANVRLAAYHVVDNNRHGLELLRARPALPAEVVLHEQNVLNLSLPVQADVVFSIGLIEHFGEADTEKAVAAHLKLLKPGGFAIISWPTPTWLYRASRGLCEVFGVWKFPDERALRAGEVKRAIAGQGEIIFEKTLWPLILTQHLLVARKIPQHGPPPP